MSASFPEPPRARPWCADCRRAATMCWCRHLAPFACEVRFAILMHPKEAKVAIGTGRMAHRAVLGSHLLVGDRADTRTRLAALVTEPSVAPAILYPARGALDLSQATPEAARAVFPPGRRPLVILVDGTWTTAKKLLPPVLELGPIPAIAFTPEGPSRYDRLRKEPRPECCSTIEAVHAVIERLAALGVATAPPERAHDRLLTLLETVVAEQLAFEPPEHRAATRGTRSAR